MGVVEKARNFSSRASARPFTASAASTNVGVLGTGVPRLACLRPTAWLCCRPVRPIFVKQGNQDLREGLSLARRTTQDLLRSGLARQAHEERRYQGEANLTRLS